MKEFPDKTVGEPPSVTNAAAGSSSADRCPDLPREMHLEPVAAPPD